VLRSCHVTPSNYQSTLSRICAIGSGILAASCAAVCRQVPLPLPLPPGTQGDRGGGSSCVIMVPVPRAAHTTQHIKAALERA
jgi:hypothetical protein